jgi:hypothetical protein
LTAPSPSPLPNQRPHLLIEKPNSLCYLSKDKAKHAMKPARPIPFSSTALAVLVLGFSHASAQQPAPNPPNPPPPVGVSFEPDLKNQPPSAKFTNNTGNDLAFIYGTEQFKLKAGDSKSVPIPNPQTFDLRIFEITRNGYKQERYMGKATPNDPKRLIQLPFFAKPKAVKPPVVPK